MRIDPPSPESYEDQAARIVDAVRRGWKVGGMHSDDYAAIKKALDTETQPSIIDTPTQTERT